MSDIEYYTKELDFLEKSFQEAYQLRRDVERRCYSALSTRIAELEAQIRKMRNCNNCIDSEPYYDNGCYTTCGMDTYEKCKPDDGEYNFWRPKEEITNE